MSNERSSWLWRDPGEAQRSREGVQESRRGAGGARGAGRGSGVEAGRGRGARGAGPLVFFWRRYEHSSHTRSRRKGGKRGWFSPAPAPGPGGVTGLAPEPVWACPGRLPPEGPGPRRGPALTPGGGTGRRQGRSAASRELS